MTLTEMIELGDPDELVREIDRLCDRRAWNDLLELRQRCHLAVERGKQLWGAAAHAEYRLALQAPGDVAAGVIESKPGRFTLGPLAEVAASTHPWAELGRSMSEGPMKAITAYECVARGERLDAIGEAGSYEASFEMPLLLHSWEPVYGTAEYRELEARFPMPEIQVMDRMTVRPKAGVPLGDRDSIDALRGLTQAWTDESNGTAVAVAVDGGLAEAAFAVGAEPGEFSGLTAESAVAWMAWAGASGGAHGRRSGAAAGRGKAWWALAAIVGALEDWPLEGKELGAYVNKLSFWTWGDLSASEGWALRLIVADEAEKIAFAVNASDRT